jgi:hypothetical protein
MSNTYQTLRDYVFTLDIIDTHEHLPAFESARPMQQDVLTEYLTHYFCCDLVSAGLKLPRLAAARDGSKPLGDRWKILAPYWEACRNTGYGRALDIAARDLYGIARIDGATIEALNDAFVKARAAGNTYRTVLKDKSKIRLSILDMHGGAPPKYDRDFFRIVLRVDSFVAGGNAAQLEWLAGVAGVPRIRSLTDLMEAWEKLLDERMRDGMPCLKCALAYSRTLRFERTSLGDAEDSFNRMLHEDVDVEWDQRLPQAGRKMQDYMMHHVCRLAERRGLTMEVHTGLQEGIGNYIYHSDPALLANLFLQYGELKFDLFHISYPYQQTLSALAKNFANVFIDFAWAHIISPTAAVNALVEFLDAVPANKISGFGGDYAFVDGVYGHQYLAREDIARALAVKVDAGTFDLDRAKQIAQMLLFDNPKAIFNLDRFLKPSAPKTKGKAKR